MKAKQGLIIVAVILGLLLLVSAYWGWTNNKAKNALIQDKIELSGELDELTELREDLAEEVDSLQLAYESLYEENVTLQGSLSEAESKIAAKEAAIRNERQRSASEVNNLRAEIQDLLSQKSDLESSIFNLQAENDSLKAVTELLTQDLSAARNENEELANMNRMIQDEVSRLTLANFKASAFQVTVENKRGTKVTAKSGKARRIRVSFDLTNVPEEYQGLKTIYLTIADDRGTPVQDANPIKARVTVNGQATDIIAVAAQEENLEANQRLSFTHELEEKIDAGLYRVTAYTDVGLLGASSFRLR